MVDTQGFIAASVLAELIDSSSGSEDEYDDTLYAVATQSNTKDILVLEILQSLELKKRNSIQNYINETVPMYTEAEFKTHFRISKDLFQALSNRFQESEIYQNLRPDKSLPATTYMAVFLWFAGHEACSFRDISDRFNISISSVSRVVEKITLFLSSLSPEVIKWPSDEKKSESALFFGNKSGFWKAIGEFKNIYTYVDILTELFLNRLY